MTMIYKCVIGRLNIELADQRPRRSGSASARIENIETHDRIRLSITELYDLQYEIGKALRALALDAQKRKLSK